MYIVPFSVLGSQLIMQEAYKQYQDALDYFMMVRSFYLCPGVVGVADK